MQQGLKAAINSRIKARGGRAGEEELSWKGTEGLAKGDS